MIHDRVSQSYERSRFLSSARRRKRGVLVLWVMLLTLLTAWLAWLGGGPPVGGDRPVGRGKPVGRGRPAGGLRLAWAFSPASNTVALWLMPAAGSSSQQVLAGLFLLSASSPLSTKLPGHTLCGTDRISFLASSQVAVYEGVAACWAQLRLTARDGETAVVPVTVPAQLQDRLYCFGNPAGRAVYITIDDGWFPDPQALAVISTYRLPVTAFLIQQAAQEHLSYWRAFIQAGGTIGDHTVSHPNLTTLTLGQATAQWAGARQALGNWFGTTPVIGRPPYGAFGPMVEEAAAQAGLTSLAGWSATVSGNRVMTWDGRSLRPGEIVILHWAPGLGRQLVTLLGVIRAQHLHPTPLTPASFIGITPQLRSLDGD